MGVIYTLGATSGSDTSVVTANASDVLNPKVIVDKNGNPLTGTMTNNGAFNRTTPYGGTVTIPEGYHNGHGVITGGEFSFSGTAGQGDVLKGQTFYANNGTKLTGTMTNNGAYNKTTSYGGSVTIPAGYHNGSGKITGGTMTFSGNAGAWQVLRGATFYSNNGTLQTGTMNDYRDANTDYELLYLEGNGGRFRIKMINNGCFNANSYISLDMAYMLSTLTASKYDNYNGREIRKGPGTDYSNATYYYTGRKGGYNNLWHEVIVYGWQCERG